MLFFGSAGEIRDVSGLSLSCSFTKARYVSNEAVFLSLGLSKSAFIRGFALTNSVGFS